MYEDIHRFYTTSETEGDDRGYSVEWSEKPYCMRWETVREEYGSNEFTTILGSQQWTMQNLMGQPGLQSNQ